MSETEDVDLPPEMDDDGDQAPAPDYAEASGPDGSPDSDDRGDPVEPADDPIVHAECAAFPLNDYGNGLRFVRYFGRDVMHVARVGWFTWTGQVWRKDPDEISVRRRAQRISGLVLQEVRHLVLSDRQMALLDEERALTAEYARLSAASPDDTDAEDQLKRVLAKLDQVGALKKTLGDMRKAHRSFARTSGNSARISSALTEGRVDISHEFQELDAAPLDVNTESGVLRFSVAAADPDGGCSDREARVRLVHHDREQLITKIMPTEYRPEDECPGFMAFLERVQPNAEMRAFLQRWFGLSMTALTGEQKLVFFYGAGANGKSVLVDLMARIFGDYSAVAKIESLIGQNRRSGGDATPDLVPLMGARMVRASEPDEGERLQEGKIKEMTGGEPILVRALQEDFVEVLPVFKLTMQGNHKPQVRGTDDGIWRRLLLVPFDVQIPPDERDPQLVEKLFAERAGILNWCVQGLLQYLEGGLAEPEEIIAATQAFREESDPIGAFLTECTVVTAEATDFVKAGELKDAVQFWQRERGEGAWGDRTISNRLKDKADKWKHPGTGLTFTRGKNVDWGYRGIKLTDTFRDKFERRNGGRGGREEDIWQQF